MLGALAPNILTHDVVELEELISNCIGNMRIGAYGSYLIKFMNYLGIKNVKIHIKIKTCTLF